MKMVLHTCRYRVFEEIRSSRPDWWSLCWPFNAASSVGTKGRTAKVRLGRMRRSRKEKGVLLDLSSYTNMQARFGANTLALAFPPCCLVLKRHADYHLDVKKKTSVVDRVEPSS